MEKTQLSCSVFWLSRCITIINTQDDKEEEKEQDDERLTERNGDRTPDVGDGASPRPVIVVDCRPTEAYHTAHVCGALSLSLPTLMTRRLGRRQLAASTVMGVIQQQQQRGGASRLTTNDWRQRAVVFYDDSTSVSLLADLSTSSSCLVMLLARRFNDDGHCAMILDGQFHHDHGCFHV